jgi:NNP family nitrate/nitrite transporter-like MFS transporter
MVWVLMGPLAVQMSKDLGLDAAQKGLMVAIPVLAGALLRVVNGVAVDYLKPKLTGAICQVIVIAGLLAAWYFGIHTYGQTMLLGIVLGLAGASFAIALPLASRWYPPEHQGSASPAPAIRVRCSPRCSPPASPSRSAGPMCSAWSPCRW